VLNKKCPCCGGKQMLLSFEPQRQMFPCESNPDYKCLHCTHCNNQIGKPVHGQLYHFKIIFLFIISWIFSQYIRYVLDIWQEYDLFFVDIPFMLVFISLYSSIRWFFTNLECVQVKDKNRFDNVNLLDVENNPTLTGFEKGFLNRASNAMTIFQGILVLFIVLGIIYSIFIK
jgi:hypothetical protein